MKTLLCLVLLAGPVYADQSAESFGTGFANGLNQALYGQYPQPYQQPVYGQPYIPSYSRPIAPQRIENYPTTGHFDMQRDYGSLSGYAFESYQHCMNFVAVSNVYGAQCVWVGQ